MSELKAQIGKYDGESCSVAVTFTSGAVVHQRSVNAVLDASGKYDRAATADRVAEVTNGVAHKIAVGAITSAHG